jgi:putative DNA primase/helicase
MERGHFRQPKSAMKEVEQLHDLGNPIAVFIREACVIAPGQRVSVDDLFRAWSTWCARSNRDAGNKQMFGKDFAAAMPGMEVTKPRGTDGKQHRTYEGIGLVRDTPLYALADSVDITGRPPKNGACIEDSARRTGKLLDHVR